MDIFNQRLQCLQAPLLSLNVDRYMYVYWTSCMSCNNASSIGGEISKAKYIDSDQLTSLWLFSISWRCLASSSSSLSITSLLCITGLLESGALLIKLYLSYHKRGKSDGRWSTRADTLLPSIWLSQRLQSSNQLQRPGDEDLSLPPNTVMQRYLLNQLQDWIILFVLPLVSLLSLRREHTASA